MARVLVVEDDINFAKALQKRLEVAGHEALLGIDAEIGIDMLGTEHPDIAIVDIEMPKGGGFAVAQAIMQLAKPIPFMFLTVVQDPEIRRKASSFRPIAYLEKPYDPEIVMKLINEHT